MPYVTIEMIEGRTKKQKEQLMKEIVAAVAKNTGVKETSVHVIIHDIPKENITTSGVYRG